MEVSDRAGDHARDASDALEKDDPLRSEAGERESAPSRGLAVASGRTISHWSSVIVDPRFRSSSVVHVRPWLSASVGIGTCL